MGGASYGLRLLGDDGDQHGSASAFVAQVMARGSIFDLMIGVPSDCSGAFAGCERMPAALRAHGLADALGVIDAGNLQVVVADPVRDRETGVIGLKDLLGLSEVVRDAVWMHLSAGRRPLLIGGDCTLLLGVWAALTQVRPEAGLLFVDGHLDCFDGQTSPTGEGADMELGALLGIGPSPLVGFADRVPALSDERAVVLGPFDEDDARGLGAPNPRRFAPRMPIVVSDELQQDPSRHTTRALARLSETSDGFWLHLDLDVLSASALPAVDYADERGLSWEQLGELLGVALSSSQLIGASVVILNPTLDTDGAGARRVVRLLADAHDQARQRGIAK
jgi:arginase